MTEKSIFCRVRFSVAAAVRGSQTEEPCQRRDVQDEQHLDLLRVAYRNPLQLPQEQRCEIRRRIKFNRAKFRECTPRRRVDRRARDRQYGNISRRRVAIPRQGGGIGGTGGDADDKPGKNRRRDKSEGRDRWLRDADVFAGVVFAAEAEAARAGGQRRRG